MDATPTTPQADRPPAITHDRAQPKAGSEIVRGMLRAAPVAPAIAAYGLVFGAQATQKGLSFWEVPLMTGSNYAGGSEFAAINVWSAPPPIVLIVALTLLINSRHIIMGATLTPFIRHYPRGRALLLLFFMSDESWAVSYRDTMERVRAGEAVPFSLRFYVGCAAVIYLNWLVSTTAGAAIGPLLGPVDRYGFDMAFPATFLVIVVGMWQGVRKARPWLVSLVSAAAVHLVVPGAWYIIVGVMVGLASAFLWADAP